MMGDYRSAMDRTVLSVHKIRIWWYIVIYLAALGAAAPHMDKNQIVIEDDILLESSSFMDPISLKDMKQRRWSKGIVPFDINTTIYSVWDEYVIDLAMKEIEKNTCIKFVKRTDEVDYIYITPAGGCWSYLGRKGTMQTLSLNVPGCINIGTVIHELMHVLGFWHEQSRSDRDHYVMILWENVMEEKENNFAKLDPKVMNIDLPYDYFSVMHYDAFAFSKGSHLPTLKPLMPNIRLRDLGRAKTVGCLTETDALKVNDFYECQD